MSAPRPVAVRPETPFVPSLVPTASDEKLLRSVLGEAGKLLVAHPELASPRTWVDLWNLFLHRNQSLDLDDFGYDEAAARVWQPLFDFLYRVWWRVTLTGVENVPNEGRALLVVNHSGVLPWDGAMVKFGIANEHPARRQARLLAVKKRQADEGAGCCAYVSCTALEREVEG